MSKRIAALGAALCMAATLMAQEGPVLRKPTPPPAEQKPTITSEVNLVNVAFVARDKKGKIVKLGKDELKVAEDGRPQTVKDLTQETNLPLTLGLLVDTSFAQRTSLDKERAASKALIDQLLREDKDKAFVIHFDREVELVQDMTNSRTKLRDAIDKLQTANRPTRSEDDDRNGGQQPQGGSYPGGGYPGGGSQGGRGGHGGGQHAFRGTTMNDAVFLASDELLEKPKGRKALIVLSDGMDHASKVSLERALEAAQRNDVMVYAVYFEGEMQQERQEHMGGGYPGGHGRYPGGGYPGGYPGGGYPGGGGGGGGYPGGGDGSRQDPKQMREEGKKNLQRVAKETGGRYFELSKKQTVDQIYGEIQDELRNQYSLTYTPDHPSTGYHKIAVTAVPKDVEVQAREGYYGK